MNKQQSGFTLIELIMVIVILGVLSAFAVPKFANLTGDAENAKNEGAFASVKSAAGIAHAAHLVGGGTSANATGDTVTLEGSSIALVYGYPAATVAGIASAAGLDCTNDFTCTPTAGSPNTLTVANGTCSFVYSEPTGANVAPGYTAPSC